MKREMSVTAACRIATREAYASHYSQGWKLHLPARPWGIYNGRTEMQRDNAYAAGMSLKRERTEIALYQMFPWLSDSDTDELGSLVYHYDMSEKSLQQCVKELAKELEK